MKLLSGRLVPTPNAQPDDQEARIATLERAVREQEHMNATLRAQVVALQRVANQLPYALYWKDENLVYQGCNRRFADDLGLAAPDAIVGLTDADLPWQSDEAASFAATDRRILATQTTEYDDQETVIHPDGTQEWFETYKIPLVDADGSSVGVLATYTNITARKQAEATVLQQASLIEELATPVIPLTDQILMVPMVGTVDARRSHLMIDVVLRHVQATHAQTVLLDITGVPIIDTEVAEVFLQLEQSVRLLGARLVLTGMRPDVAQTLVSLGVALSRIVTVSRLQQAITELIGRPSPATAGRGSATRGYIPRETR